MGNVATEVGRKVPAQPVLRHPPTAYLQLRFSAWPIHPIGLLMMYAYPMRRIWFSNYGGATAYRRCEPLFVGVVVGEGIAAARFAILAAA